MLQAYLLGSRKPQKYFLTSKYAFKFLGLLKNAEKCATTFGFSLPLLCPKLQKIMHKKQGLGKSASMLKQQNIVNNEVLEQAIGTLTLSFLLIWG